MFSEFSSKFHIPNVVTLSDPKSNVATVNVMRRGTGCYLTQGWNQLVRFYCLYGGKWVRMMYVDDGLFLINVYKENTEEINYPKMEQPITGPHLHAPHSRPSYKDSVIFYEPPFFVGTYKKTINYAESVGHRLKLSLDFAGKALPIHDGSIEIIDSNGMHWPCSFVHHTDDPECGEIIRGWQQFNAQWHLLPGTNVTFGVKKYHTRTLYIMVD